MAFHFLPGGIQHSSDITPSTDFDQSCWLGITVGRRIRVSLRLNPVRTALRSANSSSYTHALPMRTTLH